MLINHAKQKRIKCKLNSAMEKKNHFINYDPYERQMESRGKKIVISLAFIPLKYENNFTSISCIKFWKLHSNCSVRIMEQKHHCSNNVSRKANKAFQSIYVISWEYLHTRNKPTPTEGVYYVSGLWALVFLIVIFSVHFSTHCEFL